MCICMAVSGVEKMWPVMSCSTSAEEHSSEGLGFVLPLPKPLMDPSEARTPTSGILHRNHV